MCIASCGGGSSAGPDPSDSTAMVKDLFDKGKSLVKTDADSTLVLLLDAVDYSKGCHDAEMNYELYKFISEIYEQKNLCDQQQKYQVMMADLAHRSHKRHKESQAYQRIATTSMVMGANNKAIAEAKKAIEIAEDDSLEFKAQTLLLISQIWLQVGEKDSMRIYLDKAVSLYPKIASTEIYKLSHLFALFYEGKTSMLDKALQEYRKNASLYFMTELVRFQMELDQENFRWEKAYWEANELIKLTDSISAKDASSSMARIHELQHEQTIEKNRTEMLSQQSRYYRIIIVALCLLIIIGIITLIYRKKAIIAHDKELEAMRLADEAQIHEAVVRDENIQLQKLYYEHLYAIILPILNAHRGKTGHIDLEESSWKLIESNTDSVLPGFTTKLRRGHPMLTTDDVRFCCMIMMKVPNAILADVYGIAPSSVAIKKQRMKKKLDTDIHEQTIEDYLNKYVI